VDQLAVEALEAVLRHRAVGLREALDDDRLGEPLDVICEHEAGTRPEQPNAASLVGLRAAFLWYRLRPDGGVRRLAGER
jgi:hypothetical protein